MIGGMSGGLATWKSIAVNESQAIGIFANITRQNLTLTFASSPLILRQHLIR